METIELLENSDDSSNDTIIVSPKLMTEDVRIGDADSAEETELNILLGKYLSNSSHLDKDMMKISETERTSEIFTIENAVTHTNFTSTIVESMPITTTEELTCHSSDDSSNFPSFSSVKKKKICFNSASEACKPMNKIIYDEEEPYMSGFQDNIFVDNEQKINLKNHQEKGQKTSEREYIRKQKAVQKEFKKQEQQRDTALKEALVNHYKNLKPENCLKFIMAHVDIEITTKVYWQDIVSELENANINFKVEPQEAPSIISWTRKLDSYCLDQNVQLIDISKELEIEEVLVVIESNDLIIKIYEKSFLSHIESLCTNLKGKKIMLAIYGLDKYIKSNKGKRRENTSPGGTYSDKDYLPVISRRTMEYALTEIQLLYNVSHRMLETKKDIALMCLQLTKSIAQLPHKLEKRKIFLQTKWFMAEDNKNCIRIDKNGNGLPRLWKQIITTFPLASLETAEAVCGIYSTPWSLMKVYDNVTDSVEGEKLLQDISIRRTAGPISTMRKVGPEFSKKMYHLFTSLDPDKIL